MAYDWIYWHLIQTARYYRQLQHYTADLYTSQFTVTPIECPQSSTVSTIRFLATDSNTGDITVSLNQTLHIAHVKSPRYSRSFNYIELHWIILMPPFLCSQAHILTGWRLEAQLARCHFISTIFDCHHKRLPQFFFLAAWDPRYIASGRPPQKTPFPNNSSLLCRCVYIAVAYKQWSFYCCMRV
jgi:hypothetical protein